MPERTKPTCSRVNSVDWDIAYPIMQQLVVGRIHCHGRDAGRLSPQLGELPIRKMGASGVINRGLPLPSEPHAVRAKGLHGFDR